MDGEFMGWIGHVPPRGLLVSRLTFLGGFLRFAFCMMARLLCMLHGTGVYQCGIGTSTALNIAATLCNA
jgi:hypothetical protein